MKYLALLLCALALPIVGARAQEEPSAEDRAAVADAIRQWVVGFEKGRLGSRGVVRRGFGLQPPYVAPMRRAGLVGPADYERVSHFDMLGKLLSFAERHPDEALAAAMLDVAAVGIEGAFLDRQALEVREAGHWALMRTEHRGAWYMLLRVAGGDGALLFADVRRSREEEEEDPVGPARRVAALRLLGMKNRPVFRSTIEACLFERDPRVRLAAVEALDFQRRPESLARAVEVIRQERHPVVSQALARLVRVLVRLPGDEPPAAARREAVAVALAQFGRSGWRTDMDLLDLVELYPSKAVIPHLIAALERANAEPDQLVATVNARASLQLRERAGELLLAMTGALIPLDRPAEWRRFWREEKEALVVPTVLKKERSGGTRAAFFGVPVTGASIAFLIDTSGSMREAVVGTGTGSSRRRDTSRLSAAKEQMALAVQAMDPVSCYQLLTFASAARVWTRQPIRPGRLSTRSLTELLSRLHPDGGTNLFDGLVQALQLDELGYGEQHEMKIDELFVLSDGEPTAGEVRDTETMLKLVREANRYAKVRIHCVFTGAGKGSELLRRLAEENGGVFVQR